MQALQNCILYDWCTASFLGADKSDIIALLGLTGCAWADQDTGSRLRYGHRMAFDGISIHYTDAWDTRHNQGVCVEMSGQGCRDFETFGTGDWAALFNAVAVYGGRVTRCDVAYDDFTGDIPIDIMYAMAQRFYFTARSQKLQLMAQSDDGNPDHMGISVCHGSKSSNIFIRCYDKRAEKHAWEVPHWVRMEIQIRNDDVQSFIDNPLPLGDRLSGVLSNYLNYLCPDPDDSNKRRWTVAPWWAKLLRGMEPIHVHTARDVEYNKDRLDKHIYKRNHNAVKAEILADGLPHFLAEVFGHSEELPARYQKILQASQNSAEILRILGETSTTGQINDILSGVDRYRDANAIN